MENMKKHKVQVGNLNFSAAHFLIGEEFGIEAIHGHNFSVEVTIEKSLDDEGIVIDFIQVKEFSERVLQMMDHKLLIPADNPRLSIQHDSEMVIIKAGKSELKLKQSNVFEISCVNTSAELIAEFIAEHIFNKLKEVNLVNTSGKLKIKVSEEPGCIGICKIKF